MTTGTDVADTGLAAEFSEELHALKHIFGEDPSNAYNDPFGRNPERVNVNTSSIEVLIDLPGIDQETATRIITLRPFNSLSDLEEVPGVGPKLLKSLEEWITVSIAEVLSE